METVGRKRLQRYYAIVCAAGFAALAAGVAAERVAFEGERLGILFLVILVVAGELFPIRLSRGDDRAGTEIATSTTFAFALLVMAGVPATMVALGGASLIAGFARRKPTPQVAFDFARYALALSAARVVLAMAGPADEVVEQARRVGLPLIALVLGAGFAFFAVNHALQSGAIALRSGRSFVTALRADAVFQASTTGVLLILSPVIVASAIASPLLVPLLAVLMALLHRYAATMLANEHQALHDALTGLPNRELFSRYVAAAIAADMAEGKYTGVVLLDLDQFKEVNDTLGHSFGDLLLREVARRLETVVTSDTAVARLGGDEFALLFRGLDSAQGATDRANALMRALGKAVLVDDFSLEVGASCGIAVSPEDGVTSVALLQRADVAMYQSKRNRAGVVRYRADLDPYSPERLTMFGEVRQAVVGRELIVYYQPKADITGLVIGVEALVRWEHPRLGVVNPAAFLPLIQQAGLNRDLTLLVLDEALAQVRRWHDEGVLIGVAVNVTEHDLTDPRFLADVARLLETYKLSPAWLEIEITEETVMRDADRLMGILAILREIGIQLALDDFGTGYSSLAYLSRLRVSELKIDKSFVMGMDTNSHNYLIVKSTIELAHALGLRAVAEGVDDADCWEQLKALGCDVIQGYYLKRPLAADELTPWLKNHCARIAPESSFSFE